MSEYDHGGCNHAAGCQHGDPECPTLSEPSAIDKALDLLVTEFEVFMFVGRMGDRDTHEPGAERAHAVVTHGVVTAGLRTAVGAWLNDTEPCLLCQHTRDAHDRLEKPDGTVRMMGCAEWECQCPGFARDG